MSITIKKDAWRIKDSNGVFHSTDLFSTMLPNEAQQLISETRAEFVSIENEVDEVLENLEDSKQELIAEGTIQKNAIASEGTNQIAAVNTKGQEVLASIPSDYTELTKTVDSIARGGFIYDTAAGSTASFDDGADSMLIKSLVVDIEPQQDLHGYDHPWVGGTGKNLLAQKCENQTVSGVSFTWDDQGVIHCSGTPNATFIYDVNGGDPFMLDAGTYYLSGKNAATTAGSTAIMLRTVRTSSSSNVAVNDASGQSVSFTLNEATSLYPIIYISSKAAPIDGVTFSPMVRLVSETDDSYEPYENFCPITGWTGVTVSHSEADTSDPETISVNWQSEAGTVYGGTINIVSGKLTATKIKLVFDGSEDENWLRYISPKHRFFYINEPSIFHNTSTNLPYISNKLNNAYIVLDTGELGFYFSQSDGNLRVRYADDNNLTVDDLRAWLASNPLEIVADLIEPITYQLTPQEVECFLGVNNIWADTGDVTVTYPVDTKTYIDKKIQEAISGVSGS